MFFTSNDLVTNTLDYNYQDFLFENDVNAFTPEFFLVIAIFISLWYLLHASILSSSDLVIDDEKVQRSYPILVVNASWILGLSILFTQVLYHNNPITKAAAFYNTFQLDDLSLFFKVLVLITSALCMAIALQYIQQESLNVFELLILTALSTVSMLFLISASDFISMYLAIELQSLCFYVMAGIKRDSEFSTEAGVKYFLLGAFSSGILLFGCSLLYGFTGSSSFSDLTKIFQSGSEQSVVSFLNISTISSSKACELGMLLVLVGLLFKLTAVPFHMWAPDVYVGAPTSVTAFFAVVPKISFLAVLIKLCYSGFYDFMTNWQKMLIISSIACMVLGAFAALSQNKIKRLLAWSSIAHVGYLLIGICCVTLEGIQALIIYLVVYLVITLNLFAIVLSPVQTQAAPVSMGQSHNGVGIIKYITDLALCAKTNKGIAITITIAMFSIAGIPPLAGFYSKAFLMFVSMSAEQYVLAVVGILTSVISCFYYIRLIKIMYFETPNHWLPFMQISKETALVLGATTSFLLFFCLNPTPLFLAGHTIALCFFS